VSDRQEITALPAEELASFLGRVRLAAAYEAGELCCSICGDALNEAGLGAARANAEGDVLFVCQKLDCQETFHATT
jgi:hypothetical protein